MYIKEKFKEDYAIMRSVIVENDSPGNKVFGYGCISRTTDSRGKNTFFNQSYYGLVYCIEGEAKYIDADTKKEYHITPGCIIQRMPGVKHNSVLPPNSYWREFYVQGSCDLFHYLCDMGLAVKEPVINVGLSEIIETKLIRFAERLESLELHKTHEIIPEFIKLIMFILSYRPDKAGGGVDMMANIISENLDVGISMDEIAAKCGMPYETLRKKFTRAFGYSPEKYRILLRIEMAKNLLINKGCTVKETASVLGYYDSYAFCKQFKKIEGVAPGIYAANNRI